ncbi:hypothetical protein DT019_08615 [Streptomyces sp. SDr-06]|nr:hypothetical protein DT019_08615 [Streptomyces sp. SDr-06]
MVSYNGGKVHTMTPGQEEHPYPLCRGGGMNQNLTQFRTIDAPLTCKTCLTYAERRKSATVSTDSATDEGETMAAEKNDINTPEGKATLEQIAANIERAASLAEAENVEALEELGAETEALITSLRGKDSIKAKKKARDDWRAAATVQEKPKAKSKSVAPKEEAPPVKTYDQFEGVQELVNLGAEKVVEGVQLHVKASAMAEEIATIGFDMWTLIPNSKDLPDVMGDSDQAKKASGALKQAAGEALARSGMDAYDAEKELEKLWRLVQAKRTDVRAQRLRNLDSDNEQAQADRKRFAAVLKGKPDDVPASRWVADQYNTSLIGASERDAIEYHIKKNDGVLVLDALPARLRALVEFEPAMLEPKSAAELESPDVKLTAAVDVLEAAAKKVGKHFSAEEIAAASDEVRTKERERLENIIELAKEMLKATI